MPEPPRLEQAIDYVRSTVAERRTATRNRRGDPVDGDTIRYLHQEMSFEREQRIRLSALTTPQIRCLVLFVDWLRLHPTDGARYCPSP